jgi:hypothetical protein
MEKQLKFWRNVSIGNDNDCWEWQKYRNAKGYGMAGFNKKVMLTHRIAWLLSNGDIPSGIQVLHHCDNPPCCNPNHLFLGTNYDNVIDKIKKGRSKLNIKTGENHYFSKLTEASVLQIRTLYFNGEKQKNIAKHFNISVCTVEKILAGTSWNHKPLTAFQ